MVVVHALKHPMTYIDNHTEYFSTKQDKPQSHERPMLLNRLPWLAIGLVLLNCHEGTGNGDRCSIGHRSSWLWHQSNYQCFYDNTASFRIWRDCDFESEKRGKGHRWLLSHCLPFLSTWPLWNFQSVCRCLIIQTSMLTFLTQILRPVYVAHMTSCSL